eukprot:NODE_313_length_11219_cov_0.287770.p8 type:complete len:100 gc:universal NODE_313_length_11219_cov_0.287770:10419-10718(+)
MTIFELFGERTNLEEYSDEIDNICAHTVGKGTRYQYIQKICNFLIWLLQYQHNTVEGTLREAFFNRFNQPLNTPANATAEQIEEAQKEMRDDMVIYLRD